MTTSVRIATRKSPLALWQARYVGEQLRSLHPGVSIELVEMTTQGDRFLDAPLAAAGGKGLFLKELEDGLLAGRADIAVHSMKDVTVMLPEGLQIAAICKRADPLDAFVSNRHARPAELPPGARLGTSSLRRQCQMRAAYPGLAIIALRGNVNTRLRKLDDGEFDAIVLAAAGLQRLGMADRIASLLSPDLSLPAVGQGAIGIEAREDDDAVLGMLSSLDHGPTRTCVTAERAMNAALDGGCQVPIGAHAELRGEELELRGLVGTPDGQRIVRTRVSGPARDPEEIGRRAAAELIAQGAREILDELYRQT